MELNETAIKNLDRVKRVKLINAISGIKPANLVGSISGAGVSNLAIFTSVVHLGSDPALLGFILRPTGKVPRHTYENIRDNGCYTINHIRTDFVRKAHYTSAKFAKGVSEFAACGLTEEYRPNFPAPFVKESPVKIGMQFLEALPIRQNDTRLIVGEIKLLILPEESLDQNDEVDLEMIDSVGVSGLNSYYGLKRKAWFPYARVSELPGF